MGTLVSFHAHPDDESIATGGTLARAAAAGHRVVLVFATRGELGEPVPGVLEPGQQLAMRRSAECYASAAALGAQRVEFLGFTDSGMMGEPSNDAPFCFWRASVDHAARRLAVILDEEEPDVLTVYDDNGGYGHPDHIQAHRVAMRAVEAAAEPCYRPDLGAAWQVAKVYWNAMPRSVVREGVEAMAVLGEASPFDGLGDLDEVPFVVPDEVVTCAVDARAYAGRKDAAMRAHPTQITVDGPFFALSNNLGQEVLGVEYYRLVAGERGPAAGPDGREDDLFAGLEE